MQHGRDIGREMTQSTTPYGEVDIFNPAHVRYVSRAYSRVNGCRSFEVHLLDEKRGRELLVPETFNATDVLHTIALRWREATT